MKMVKGELATKQFSEVSALFTTPLANGNNTEELA
jgi:hypothetical protein